MDTIEAKEDLVLVDSNDQQLGILNKEEVHRKGLLHRAVSVFLFNSQGKLLMQQRALTKYHSAGLWTNSCCTHPRPEEETLDAAQRRLMEEMGIDTLLEYSFSFIYKTAFDNGLIEHEYDHVFIGSPDELPDINPNEVASWKYELLEDIIDDVALQPNKYTSWFRIILRELIERNIVVRL